MKKLLTLVSVIAVAGAISTASASDRTGKIGLGAQASFAGTGFSSSRLGAWSVKYGVAHNINGQFVVGFDFGNKGQNRMAEFGARLLYDVVEMENSDFYVGLGVGWNQDKAPADVRVLRMQIPLGFEFSFAGLPEIGFSTEVGLMYDYAKATKTNSISSVGAAAVGGIHYYF